MDASDLSLPGAMPGQQAREEGVPIAPGQDKPPQRAIVVLGMHRGGTSALTRTLALYGAALPKRQLEANFANELGYWEPSEVVAIHDEILAAVDSSWHDVCEFPRSWFASDPAAAFRRRLVAVLREDYGEAPLFIVKDPRLCRLVPLWRSVLDEFGATPGYVIPIRNPLEIAASLKRRDGFPAAKSLLLWLRHFLAVERDTRGLRRSFVRYERLLRDWRAVVDRIGADLGLSWPRPTHAAELEIESFLSGERRHNFFDDEELYLRREVVEWIKAAFNWATRAADGEPASADELDLVHAALETADTAFAPLVAAAELNLTRLSGEMTRLSGQKSQLSEEKARLSEEMTRLSNEHAALTEAHAGLASELQIGNAERDRLQNELALRGGEIAARDAELGELSAQAVRLRGEVVAREGDVARLRDELAVRGGEIASRDDELGRLRDVVAGLQDEAAQRDAALGALHGKIGEAERRLADAERRTEAVAAERNEALARVQAFETSTTWRATGALRRTLHTHPGMRRLARRAFNAARWAKHMPRRMGGQGRSGGNGAGNAPAASNEPSRQRQSSPSDPDAADCGPGTDVYSAVRYFTAPGPGFEAHDPSIVAGGVLQAKLFAFYLPQFHPIAENDEWWGAGFTEWRNVARGIPRFAGHFQPRLPRDLSFYDLRNPDTLRHQVALAKSSGISGFAFYLYWFNGRRLLEGPLDRFVEDETIDFPFCVVWANENWTRRWDGLDAEVLIGQDYRPEDDELLVDTFHRYLSHKRYLRVEGRPVLVVYRADTIPETAATLARWRRLFAERHGYAPLLVMCQCFGSIDPRPFGFDAALEVPPHKVLVDATELNSCLQTFDAGFSGHVHDYHEAVRRSLADRTREYPLIKTVFPGWDNDARRQGAGMVVHNSSPGAYQRWLHGAIEIAKSNPFRGEPLVFINAWNEWAEGAYLEPDLHYGAAYLNATARAVVGGATAGAAGGVLLVGHDARRHGAPRTLLSIAKMLGSGFGVKVHVLLLDGGDLEGAYAGCCDLTVAGDAGAIDELLDGLARDGWSRAITNTVVCGSVVPALKAHGFSVVSLIHELPGLIAEYGLEERTRTVIRQSDCVVFSSRLLKEAIEDRFGPVAGRAAIHPQGLYNRLTYDAGAAARLRRELGLADTTKIVLNLGFGDLRKGIDLFVQAAAAAGGRDDFHFVWLGNLHQNLKQWLTADVESGRLSNLTFLPHDEEIGRYLSAADALFLSSREDPFPSVVLEALSIGVPVVGFAGAGGFCELLQDDDFGAVVPFGDIAAVLAAIDRLVARAPPQRAAVRAKMIAAITRSYRVEDYAFALLRQFDDRLKKISVVLPNYDYARHLPSRLHSIWSQSYPIYECIVLDDASTDDSQAVIEQTARRYNRQITTLYSATNSGNAFRQWCRGLEQAGGELIWIAEADDLADPRFLERLVRDHLAEPGLRFAFSDSVPIDGDGSPLAESYKPYYAERIGPDALAEDFVMEAGEFAAEYLSVANLMLNASAVLWNRQALGDAIAALGDELFDYEVAGDWRLYVEACRAGGRVAYCAQPLNRHRRHPLSTTSTLDARRHLAEIGRLHACIGAAFGPAKARQAERYLADLAAQFGLAPATLEA